MSDLRVNASALRGLSGSVTQTESQVRFGAELSNPSEAVLGSAGVASALGSAAAQQSQRSVLASDAIGVAGRFPATAAAELMAADAALARAF